MIMPTMDSKPMKTGDRQNEMEQQPDTVFTERKMAIITGAVASQEVRDTPANICKEVHNADN